MLQTDNSGSKLLEWAQQVADGADPDWNDIESGTANTSERLAIQQLRKLATIRQVAQAHRAATWGPLELRESLGRGTFGTVYRAWDPKLQREVALKLLDVDPGGQAAHALDEGRLMARVRHPNVVAVYGADESEGQVGIWMECISGRTLKHVVESQGPLGAREAALIGRDVCHALAAVHQRGILHRDVKAQNVMRESGGRTVLMDFGAGEKAADGHQRSALRGTPVYLAPELLSGSPPDRRSDIYSVGVLLYYLVSGTFPVTGASVEELRAAHAAGPKSLRDIRTDLPSPFVRAVSAAISPDRANRPESAGALADMLDAALSSRDGVESSPVDRPTVRSTHPGVLATALLTLVIAAAAWTWAWWSGVRSTSPLVPRNSVAIMPFEHVTGGDDDDDLVNALMQDVIGQLTTLRDLRVIAGASMQRYRESNKTPQEIGDELEVAAVLHTTVRRSGDRIRLVPQLIEAGTGVQLWSDTLDSSLSDVTQLKSDVAYRIAVALRGELSQRDTELVRGSRRYDPRAMALYSKGRHHWSLRTEPSVNRSIQFFHDALALDPQFAPAYAGLADAYTQLGVYGYLPRAEAFARAAASAEKAIALDEGLAEAHASLGYARKNAFQFGKAEESFKRAIELKPGYATAHHWYSILLTKLGRFPEALAEVKIALSLDPLSIGTNLQLASALTMMRRYDDAIAQYERTLQLDSQFAAGIRHAAKAYVHKGEYARARVLFDEARRKSPVAAEDQELKADVGFLHAISGQKAAAEAIAGELIQRHERTGEEVTVSIAAIYSGLGRGDIAIDWLTRAVASLDTEVGYLKVDPRWDGLRGDRRFVTLLRTLGLTP